MKYGSIFSKKYCAVEREPPKGIEELDKELEQYMANTETSMDMDTELDVAV